MEKYENGVWSKVDFSEVLMPDNITPIVLSPEELTEKVLNLEEKVGGTINE